MHTYSLKETLLSVNDVHVKKGDTLILRGVTTTIKNVTRPGLNQGQVVAFLGPSGIGKSTLFKVIAGLDRPTKGSVLIGDPGKPVVAGQVGVLMQTYPLLTHRRVLGNLLVAAGHMPANAARTKAMGLLEEFDMVDQANAWPDNLSGGQRQRVAIMQQLMADKRYMLMDEPFSGLDPVKTRAACRLINRVAAAHEHTTIIIVSHIINAALSVADHVWLMGRDRDAQGKIIPGARIVEEIDLKEREIAWREENYKLPAFNDLSRYIDDRFETL